MRPIGDEVSPSVGGPLAPRAPSALATDLAGSFRIE